MSYLIKIPIDIRSDIHGYDYFSKIYAETAGFISKNIIVDFKNSEWFEANLCSIFGSILFSLQLRKNTIHFINLTGTLKGTLDVNQFSRNFIGDDNYLITRNINSSTIYYNKFTINEESDIKKYVQSELLDKQNMPQFSDLAKKRILESIFEIFVNATTHGETKEIFTCGQFFYKKNPAMVYFTFVDLGKTIRANVNEFLKSIKSGSEAIQWAVQPGNTTKTGKHSGGLGLKIIDQFIRLNNGKMHIISANGFWELNRNEINDYDLEYSFPGTIITLAINLDKAKTYVMAEELEDEDIKF